MTTEQQAAQFFLRAFPVDATRAAVAAHIGRLIQRAHELSPEAWEITLKPNSLHVNIGTPEVFVIGFIDGFIVAPTDQLLHVAAPPVCTVTAAGYTSFKKLPRSLVRCSSDRFSEAIGYAGGANLALVDIAARSHRGRSPHWKRMSMGVLTYLRSSHGLKSLPNPGYWKELAETEESAVTSALSPQSIYTIKHRRDLEAAARTSPSAVLHEGKRWKTGAELVDDAGPGKVPVLFADARETSRLIAWAKLESVTLNPAGTDYRFTDLRFLNGQRKEDLILEKTQQPIESGFIRPYAIVVTPAFLSRSPEAVFNTADLDRLTRERSVGISDAPLGVDVPERAIREVEVIARSPTVRAWVLKQANGICENCRKPAPFVDDAGRPFLEVHHLHPLAESPGNAIAVCPNCHRALHHSASRDADERALRARIPRVRPQR